MNGIAKQLSSLRPSNNPTAGIVGLANIGKSTFFQAITQSKLGNPANYPFATIDAEISRIIVPSQEIHELQNIYQSAKIVPSQLTIYDIAGLTRGASRGQGLGNQFLNDIRHVDGIFHIVRGFEDSAITHLEGDINPVRDLSIVQDELILKDLDYIETLRDQCIKKTRTVSQKSMEWQTAQFDLKLLEQFENHLYDGKKILHLKPNWSLDEVKMLTRSNFLTAKPSLILLNVNDLSYIAGHEKSVEYNRSLEWIREYSSGDLLIPFSAQYEANLNSMSKQELAEYYAKKSGDSSIGELRPSQMPHIINAMKSLLNLISFYTCGPQEIRQWNCYNGINVQNAAGIIHSDLKDSFINAEILKYDTLISGTGQSKTVKGKTVGKGYVVEDRDIITVRASKARTKH